MSSKRAPCPASCRAPPIRLHLGMGIGPRHLQLLLRLGELLPEHLHLLEEDVLTRLEEEDYRGGGAIRKRSRVNRKRVVRAWSARSNLHAVMGTSS